MKNKNLAKISSDAEAKRQSSSRAAKVPSLGNSSQPKRSSSKQPQNNPIPSIVFPIDYFETCTQLQDVEYSGSSDLLEIYNSQQLKIRLAYNNTSAYSSSSVSRCVVSTRSNGFRLDITNSQPDSANRLILMGCRLLVGTGSLERTPQYVEVLGRKVTIGKIPRARWVDICLTRDEAIICDNKLSLLIGPSQLVETKVSGATTVLDGVMVYAKLKTDLGYSKNEVLTLQKK